jgi:hypothetical protein
MITVIEILMGWRSLMPSGALVMKNGSSEMRRFFKTWSE